MVLSKDKKKKPISKAKKIVNGIATAIVLTIFALALFAMIYLLTQFVSGKEPDLFGHRFYFVLTDSMNPTLKPTDMILSKVIKDSNDIDYVKSLVSEGDIVTYVGYVGNSQERITHRVIKSDEHDDVFFYDEEKESWMLITKGDNNHRADSPIPISALDAVMVRKAAVVSALYNFISNKSGGLVLILIPIALILVPFIIRFIIVLKTPAKEELTEEEQKKRQEEIARKAVQDYIEEQKKKNNDTP
ncbi:MAG: signal peptidase I [Clostridiales bacterium]|nr:signal peptidase I [Clostridiales bacterium]